MTEKLTVKSNNTPTYLASPRVSPKDRSPEAPMFLASPHTCLVHYNNNNRPKTKTNVDSEVTDWFAKTALSDGWSFADIKGNQVLLTMDFSNDY